MNKTKIPYVAYSVNPWNGCYKVSAGCANCYAEALMRRFDTDARPWTPANIGANLRDQRRQLDAMRRVLERTPPATGAFDVFVGDMTDIFLPEVPDEWRHEVFDAIDEFPEHRFMIFTKRVAQARVWQRWPENVMLVVSIENQETSDARYDEATWDRENHFRDVIGLPALMVGLSLEPLLGPVDLTKWARGKELGLDLLDWVVVGAESGAKRRPFDMAWARAVKDWCVENGIAFWFKQGSHRLPGHDPYLVEVDGSRWAWRQLPGQMMAPVEVPQ